MPGVTPVRVRKPMPLKGRFTALPADAIGDDFSPGGINVRFRFGEVRSAPGRDIFAGPAFGGENSLNLTRFQLFDTTEWVLQLTKSRLFRFGFGAPGVPREWHNVPKNIPPNPLGTRVWSTAVGENHFFFARGEEIFQWNGNALSAYDVITPTSGTVPKARFLAYFNNRLIAGFVQEGGNTFANRIRWSQNGDFTKWDDTVGLGAGFLDFMDVDELEIRGMLPLQNVLVVYTKFAIINVFPTGSLDPTFGASVAVRGTGLNAPYTLVSNGQRHFYLGYDRNVYSWDGTQLVAIGNPILEELRAFTIPGNMDLYTAGLSRNRQEYWLIVEDNNVFIYDYERDYWTRDSFPSISTVAEIDDTVNLLTWTTITGRWLQQKKTWSELVASTIAVLIAGRSDSATMLIDDSVIYDYFAIGSIMDRYVETPDYYFEDVMETGSVMRMLLIYGVTNTDPFEVGVSVDRGFSWKTQLVTPSSNGLSLIDFNITGEVVRFRFRENSATAQFRWRSMEYEFAPGGTFIGSV